MTLSFPYLFHGNGAPIGTRSTLINAHFTVNDAKRGMSHEKMDLLVMIYDNEFV
jgi:hypothetical protein